MPAGSVAGFGFENESNLTEVRGILRTHRIKLLILMNMVLVAFWISEAVAEKKELTMAIGMAIAPYNIPETNSGIELDIVSEALGMKGYAIVPKYVPFARRNLELLEKRVDGVLTINTNSGIEAFYSHEHIACENVVVSLKKKGLKIEKIKDLKGRSVVAFQEATIYLGEDFAAMAKENPKYRELAMQELQINLLYGDRVDAIVLDKNIFLYLKKRNQKIDTTQPVDVAYIFKPTPFRVAFSSRKVRDDFNEGLRKLRESGRYDEIVKGYLGTR